MKKRWIILAVILLALVIPIPTGVYKDGGTRTYTALTYKIVSWNRITEGGIHRATRVYPFPMNFFSLDSLWYREKPALPDFQPQHTEEAKISFAAQYIRTDAQGDSMEFPGVTVIKSLEQLQEYIAGYQEVFDFSRKKGQVYADTTIGFLNACDQYTEDFFESNCLILLTVEEGSGSIRHEVESVEMTDGGKLALYVKRIVPENGTDDMANWHIILEVPGKPVVESGENIQLYMDGELALDGGVVIYPIPLPAMKSPPEGRIITPDGAFALQKGGFEWTTQEGGQSWTVIADQPCCPLPRESLTPVYISKENGETVYIYVAETGQHEATNSIGYLMKLEWDYAPSSVSYTCWPDSVWYQEGVKEETVVSGADHTFYAKPGSYVYQFIARWQDTGSGCYGSAHYYVYITDGEEAPQ